MKFLSKVKNSKVVKWLSASAVCSSLAVVGAISCFAADEASETGADLTEALTSSFSSMQSDIFKFIGIAIPIALGIVGAIFGVKYAIKFFTNMSKKS